VFGKSKSARVSIRGQGAADGDVGGIRERVTVPVPALAAGGPPVPAQV